jgi:formylglycine-generating enzyme required for sulfatase activity
MVSKWEAGGERMHPRPINQEALDTFLTKCSEDVHQRFLALLGQAPVRRQATTVAPHETTPQPHERHPADRKLMALVDAGVYLSGNGNEPVWLEAFYVDVHPVTNADYARFVDGTDHPTPPHWDTRRCPEHLHQHPIVFVTWHDAHAYAMWAGKQLPTSHQWEKARGTAGLVYPWGNQPTPAKCNVREGAIGSTTPVDRYHSGVSPCGVYDLCGNVWEWCATSWPSKRQLSVPPLTGHD